MDHAPAVDDGCARMRVVERAHFAPEGDDWRGACRHAVVGPGREVELLYVACLITLQYEYDTTSDAAKRKVPEPRYHIHRLYSCKTYQFSSYPTRAHCTLMIARCVLLYLGKREGSDAEV